VVRQHVLQQIKAFSFFFSKKKTFLHPTTVWLDKSTVTESSGVFMVVPSLAG
jgi:hypothetical protein